MNGSAEQPENTSPSIYLQFGKLTDVNFEQCRNALTLTYVQFDKLTVVKDGQ